jgi:hypothetical protein
LRAVCTSVKGQKLSISLWVNGKKAIETTDTDDPLTAGGVGLFVGTLQTTHASVAEFDDFVVGTARKGLSGIHRTRSRGPGAGALTCRQRMPVRPVGSRDDRLALDLELA